ncbi:MAG TPA: hypothetical protein ENI56_00240 [Candidatus Kaiserbacteria bacterium]|nr:hypothetical protein [Candidatus Kaiserbacteria bacterium]
MTPGILFTRPATYIVGLCIVLFGIGAVSPNRPERTFVGAPVKTNTVAPTPIISNVSRNTKTNTRTAKTTSATKNTSTIQVVPNVLPSTISSRHYSVPQSIRNRGDDDGYGGDD